MEYNERYLPNGWIRTVEEVINNNFERNNWPTVEQIDCNLVNLSVDINTKIDDEAFKSYEDSVLNLTRDYNGHKGSRIQLNKDLTIDGQGHTLNC